VEAKTGMRALYDLILSWLDFDVDVSKSESSKMKSLVISDDFKYWNSCYENDSSGKLMLVDRSTAGATTTAEATTGANERQDDDNHIYQLFFDDNIERDRAHIVDVRDKDTLEAIPFAESKDRYLHRVLPYRAVHELTYFADIVDNFLKQIS
jgi:hypothetical protein